MLYERHHAWSILLRIYHWAFALSIVILTVTGFYIHFPWTNTMLEGGTTFPVATMRYIHFLAGFVFTAAVLIRLYLLLFGNRQERLWDFLPVTPRNLKNLGHTCIHYAYLGRRHEPRLGHNTLAGTAYIVTLVVAVFQGLSGFYLLYPESATWQSLQVIFGSQMEARFLHYLGMWYFMFYVLVHVYMVVWNDVVTREGLISSIFNGYKYLRNSD
ncbi:MAG TPA: Ni/Fe-hydrogenase, b-type cytochrome subunit [Desulfobulbus sp.]|nr:Ni/Fe-hydrogenase, b-type cytochrome subunit [Desulfobulbus sp.]